MSQHPPHLIRFDNAETEVMRSYQLNLSPDVVSVQIPPGSVGLLFDRYIDSLDKSGRKQITLDSYRYQIIPFFEWWEVESATFDSLITKENVQVFARWLRQDYRTKRGNPVAQNTARHCIKRARQFFHWLYVENYLDIDISFWFPVPAEVVPDVTALSVSELQALVNVCSGISRIRDLSLIAMLLDTACRRYEMSEARWEHVSFMTPQTAQAHDLQFQQFAGWLYLDKVKDYLDAPRQRTVTFGPVAGSLLYAWKIYTGETNGRIFGITASGIRHIVDRLADKAEVSVKPHDFRKTWVTYATFHSPPGLKTEVLINHQIGHRSKKISRRHYTGVTHYDVMRDYVSPTYDLSILGLPTFTPKTRTDISSDA